MQRARQSTVSSTLLPPFYCLLQSLLSSPPVFSKQVHSLLLFVSLHLIQVMFLLLPPLVSSLLSLPSPSSLVGRTPCCVDRLTSVACQRLSSSHRRRFAAQCMHSADFAFVQCCASCFDRRFSNSSQLYTKAVTSLIHQSESGDCRDVRGTEWCTSFARRQMDFLDKSSSRSFWEPWFREGCDAFPFAFRVCRLSCGFCSTGLKRASIAYSHDIATDKHRCPHSNTFSVKDEEIAPIYNVDIDSRGVDRQDVEIYRRESKGDGKGKKDSVDIGNVEHFDPLSHIDIEEWRSITGDYFVVLDQPLYDEI